MNARVQAIFRWFELQWRAKQLEDQPSIALLAGSGALWAPCTLPLRRRRWIPYASKATNLLADSLWRST